MSFITLFGKVLVYISYFYVKVRYKKKFHNWLKYFWCSLFVTKINIDNDALFKFWFHKTGSKLQSSRRWKIFSTLNLFCDYLNDLTEIKIWVKHYYQYSFCKSARSILSNFQIFFWCLVYIWPFLQIWTCFVIKWQSEIKIWVNGHYQFTFCKQ